MGRAIALRLAVDGADCVVTYRRQADRAREVVDQIVASGRRALAVELPLEDRDRVGSTFERVAAEFGRLDIFVANAAATAFRPMTEQKPHNVDLTFAISVDSFVAAVQAAVPLMRDGGRIIAISGIDSHQAMPRHGVLGAAKAAVESLVRELALELGPQRITVNGISPGMIATDSSKLYVERTLGIPWAEAVPQLEAMTPVRRIGTVDDVASLAAYLASEAASFLTGQTIILDGGLTIVSPLAQLGEQPR